MITYYIKCSVLCFLMTVWYSVVCVYIQIHTYTPLPTYGRMINDYKFLPSWYAFPFAMWLCCFCLEAESISPSLEFC